MVAVVATVWTAGALAQLSGSVLAGAVGSSAVAIGAVAGVVGSIAGQLAGLALGVQDKFNWGAVAAGAIGGTIGGSSGLLSKVPGGAFAQAISGNIIN